MEHYAGIDVSLKESSVCIVDASGKLMREVKVASEPEALVQYFDTLALPVTRIGEDRPEECARDRTAAVNGVIPTGPCEIISGPGHTNPARRTQAPPGQAARCRAQHPRHLTWLRIEGR